MIECSMHNVTKYYGANKVFEHISLEVKTGERIGLIGRNGCGKTTLMKILMGIEDYQEGNVAHRKGLRIGYLDQIFQYDFEMTVSDVLELAFEDVFKIKREMKCLEQQLSSLDGEALEKKMKDYGYLMEKFEAMEGYQIETNINKVSQGLMISDVMKGMSFCQLSGGEKTRVGLAKLLLEGPDLLLLDEPSNHLDMTSIEWLEEFLKDYKGTVIMISHDRYFLDRVVNRIVELELIKANIYNGNYSSYVIEKERRFIIEYNHYKNQQKKIEQMERQIERYRIWGEMRDSDKMYRRAKELEKRLEKIEVLDKPVLESKKLRLGHESGNRSGKIVLKVEEIQKSFDGQSLLENVNFTLFYQNSACIVGENGSGKTTLLKIIVGETVPDQGNVKIGANVKIGYLPQNVVFEDEEQTLLEYFSHKHQLTLGEARGQLARALFLKDDVHKKIKTLSGGEKSRLKLCSLTYEKVNLMILDEPTNHLDIESREVLEETLMAFEGTILFVSHDRYFIRKVADRMLLIDNQQIKVYPFAYDDFLEERKKELIKEEEIVEEDRFKEKKKFNRQPKLDEKKNDAHKLSELEVEIEMTEEKIRGIENEMIIKGDQPTRLNELFKEKKEIEEQLKVLYQAWEKMI